MEALAEGIARAGRIHQGPARMAAAFCLGKSSYRNVKRLSRDPIGGLFRNSTI
jgi:hypothetical protein